MPQPVGKPCKQVAARHLSNSLLTFGSNAGSIVGSIEVCSETGNLWCLRSDLVFGTSLLQAGSNTSSSSGNLAGSLLGQACRHPPARWAERDARERLKRMSSRSSIARLVMQASSRQRPQDLGSVTPPSRAAHYDRDLAMPLETTPRSRRVAARQSLRHHGPALLATERFTCIRFLQQPGRP